MLLLENISQFNDNNIFFCEPINNNIITNGQFIRILYSNELFVLNGIYLYIHFDDIIIEKYFNKYKCTYNIEQHKQLIENIRYIEESILKKTNILNKTPICKIYDILSSGNIKFFSEKTEKIYNNFLLKISGIWEDDVNYGVTYKFLPIH